MARCESCGNDYDKSFEVTAGGKRHTFDSFECAIHVLTPKCNHCGCRIVGHGVESEGNPRLLRALRAAERYLGSQGSHGDGSGRPLISTQAWHSPGFRPSAIEAEVP